MWITESTSERISPPRASEAPWDGDVAEWVRAHLQIDLDRTQEEALNSGRRRVLLNCTRQWGKSTITAAKAVHEAYTDPGSLTIVVSPSARQSAEFLRKAETFVVRLKIRPKTDGDNQMSLAFPNGSRIVGLPGNEATVRGFSSVSLLIVDEAANVKDELYLAVRPMLAVSGGTLWLMSTPLGKSGFFYDAWTGGAEWERIRVRAEECPRIPASFLEEERRTMGDRWYRREYECEFDDCVNGVFDMDVVDPAIREEVEPLVLV